MVDTEGRAPVSIRAAVQRVNRKLKPDGKVIKKSRGARCRMDLGEYYVLNVERNFIIHQNIDVEKWARDLGVLGDWECVVED